MVFFGKILTPLSDTKVDHYRDIQGIIVSATKCFFLNTSRTIAFLVGRFYLLIKIRKWVRKRQNAGNWEIAEPERFFCSYPLNSISTCLVKSTKACKNIILNWWTKPALIWVKWSPLCYENGSESWTRRKNGHYFDCIWRVSLLLLHF